MTGTRPVLSELAVRPGKRVVCARDEIRTPMSPSAPRPRMHDGSYDVLVAGAPAQVSDQELPDSPFVRKL